MKRDFKNDLIHSILVLLTIVNGLIAAFALGMTELIKSSLKGDITTEVAGAIGKQLPTNQTLSMNSPVWGNMQIVGVPLKENLGWIFFILMIAGIIAIIAMHYYEHTHSAFCNSQDNSQKNEN